MKLDYAEDVKANGDFPAMRSFETGATRSSDAGKPDYEGFLSPLAIEGFGAYMNKHRVQADGSLRASDNWQKGIPSDQYLKSAWRHFVSLWKLWRADVKNIEEMRENIYALYFNVQGFAHEFEKRFPSLNGGPRQ